MKALNAKYLVLPILLLAIGCNKESSHADVICTEEFVFITLTVTGGQLDDFFTIRESTGDTIRNDKLDVWDDEAYVILDDKYVEEMKNSTENFLFQGFVEDSLVIESPYKIGADECHIKLIDGKTEISL